MQYFTEPGNDPMHIEYLRFLPGCDGPELLMQKPHVAFYVDDLDQAVKASGELVFGPFYNSAAKIAFCIKDGMLFELMEKKRK